MLRLVLRTHWHHPEWCAVALAVWAWVVLLAAAAGEPGHLLGVPVDHPLLDAIGHSAVMGAAMMAPLVLPQVHTVATSTLWRRRYRAAAAFLAGFVGVWTAVGAVTLVVSAAVIDGFSRRSALAVLFAAAALAPFAPGRRRRLRRCAATRPLRLRGLRADLDAARYGTLIGRSCVGTCWVLMAAVAVDHGLLAMATASTILVRERRSLDPQAWTTAVPVAVVGALSVALAGTTA